MFQIYFKSTLLTVILIGVYFIKKHQQAVPKENCKTALIVGDLATRSIDQLSCLVDEVFVPLLSNEDNHDGWPEMVAQDVKKHVHNLKSTVYQVLEFKRLNGYFISTLLNYELTKIKICVIVTLTYVFRHKLLNVEVK